MTVDDLYPLTPLQEGLLFHALDKPDSGAYLSQTSVRLRARDPALVGLAWQGLVDRHPVLRTAFLWEGLDAPVQAVYRRATLPLLQRDLRGLSGADRDRCVADYLAADRRMPFPPHRAPLGRLAVFRLADDACQVIWTHHALILDGWSTGMLLDELVSDAPAQSAGGRAAFRDYVDWLGRQPRPERDAHWRALLGDVTGPTPPPFADAAPGAPAGSGAQCELRLSREETELIDGATKCWRIPLVVFAEAAWGLTLGRLARTDDVVFGLVVSGRSAPVPGIETMVGLLTNTVPVRVRLVPGEPVGAWLRGLLAQHVTTLAHEHSPLTEVARQSAVPPGLPLFVTVLAVQNLPGAAYAPDDAPAETFESTHYPIMMMLVPGPRLTLRLLHDPAALDPRQAEVVAASMRAVLTGLAQDASRRVAALPAYAAADLPPAAWSHGPRRADPGQTVPELIAARAAARPAATAIAEPGRAVSYGELISRAGALTRMLTARGVGREDRVGILLGRSADAVLASIAVLSAGAAYVPVDPAYPPSRIEFMIKDSRCELVLTRRELANRLPSGAAVACLDDIPVGGGPAPPPPAAHPDNLAYVIYTSGSTGSPKGVMVSHRAVLNTLRSLAAELGLRPSDVIAHKVPPGFTDAVFEVLWPLTGGAALTIADDATVRDPAAFLAFLREREVTCTQVVPRQIESLLTVADDLAADQADPLPMLKWLVIGAEALPPAFGTAWDRRFEHGRLANIYGMTESAIFATSRLLPRGTVASLGVVPMGRPIANTRVYVLDHEMALCPVGVTGEVFIAGPGLARGYLDQPALTAERFLPDPLAADGGRLYRTGDLARWRPDGELTFAGRADLQLKVRGTRVEPAEVEAALLQHPVVRDAVVAAFDGRLAAYLVPDGDKPATAELRGWVADRLPAPLVPALFTWLDAIPMTVHGKVDRAALPPPAAEEPATAGAEPSGATEQLVAAIIAKVLGRARVGAQDDFFDIGGDSLLAVRVVGQLRDVLPVPYTVGRFLARPTVAACAAALDEMLATDGELAQALAQLDAGDGHG